jgi:regulator of protease activity HflC (stomatin/prohibitin superfamily)
MMAFLLADMTPMLGVLIAFAVLVVVMALSGLKIVNQAEVIVVERLGRYHRVLTSGVNVIWPIIERPRRIAWRYVESDLSTGRPIVRAREMTRIDLREAVYDFPPQSVITRDNVNIEINALVYLQITDPKKAVYEIANLPDAIEKLAQTTLRNIIGEMDLDDTLTSRDRINRELRRVLDEAADKWGVKVNRVELQDIIPPADIRDAMEKQMRAERSKRATILDAEGQKQGQILRAEGERDSRVAQAEGQAKAQVMEADGQAEARIKMAEAEAETIRRIREAFGGGDTAGQYLIAMRYLDSLREMSHGKESKLVFLPYEATGVLASLGGIRELLRNAGSPEAAAAEARGTAGNGATRPS